MKRAAVLFAEGFEEVEALTVVDLLRRAGIECEMIATGEVPEVTGARGIRILADRLFSDTDFRIYDALILPGGGPGTANLRSDRRVAALLQDFHSAGKLTAAICAAPTVLASAGLLHGKRAVCYPGLEADLGDALPGEKPVTIDGTVVTSCGVGTAIPFALALIRVLLDEDTAERIARAIVWQD